MGVRPSVNIHDEEHLDLGTAPFNATIYGTDITVDLTTAGNKKQPSRILAGRLISPSPIAKSSVQS